MATHSTVWTGILSNAASTLSAGYAIVKNGSVYLIATTANRASYGRAVGVSLSSASTLNPAFEYQVAGVLPAALSGLADGTAEDYVIVNASGLLERTASPGGSDDIIGRCPGTSGDVVITPCASVGGGGGSAADDIEQTGGPGTTIDRVRGQNGLSFLNEDGDPATDGDDPPPGGAWKRGVGGLRPGKPSSPGQFNPEDYADGLVENDDSDPAREANKAAVDAAIADMSATLEGAKLQFPEGIYYFPEEYTISKAITIRGVAKAGYYPKTVLVFPLLGRGLIFGTNFIDIDEIALVGNYWEFGLGGYYWDRWDVSTAYALGDVVVPAQWSKWGYAFECIDAGTSGTDDSFFPGKSMQEVLSDRWVDVSVTAATNATPIAITTGTAEHGLTTGAEVIISGVLGNTAANGNWTITVTGVSSFTLDTSVGNGAYTSGGTVGRIFTDGGCIWRLRHCHGIDVCGTKCMIGAGVYIRGFAGNGINITASTSDTRQTYAANLTVVETLDIAMCGGHGICLDGFDTSVYDIRTPNVTDVGGFGLMINPALSGKFSGAHIRDPQGGCAAWIDRCPVTDIYVEGGAGPIHRGGLGRVDSAVPGSGPWDGYTDDYKADWEPATAYVIGDVVKPTTPNGYYYRCQVAGTSAALLGDEPDWPTRSRTQITTSTVADGVGTLVWERWGLWGDIADSNDILWGADSGPQGGLGGLSAGRGGYWRLGQNGTAPPLFKKIAPANTLNGAYIEQVGAEDPGGTVTKELQWDTGSEAFFETVNSTFVAWFLAGGGSSYFPAYRYCFPNGIAVGRAGIDGGAFPNAYPGIYSATRAPIVSELPQGAAAWQAGTLIHHNNPTAGAPLGWRNVSAGDPGTWETLLNVRAPAVAMGALAIDWAVGRVFTKTLAAGANVITFSNAATGDVIVVRLTGAASTVTWPTVLWAGGTPPTQTASGTDVYTFVHDGSDIYGSVVQDLS